MWNKVKNLLGNSKNDLNIHQPTDDKATFVLRTKEIEVGYLSFEKGIWEFRYSEVFKEEIAKSNDKEGDYKPIVGFRDVQKVYQAHDLWPFFKIRIPGLQQPAVKEILKDENINPDNEVALLKRFGVKTISNPFELTFCL